MLETEDDTVTNKSQGIGGRPQVSQEIHLTLDISGYHDITQGKKKLDPPRAEIPGLQPETQ